MMTDCFKRQILALLRNEEPPSCNANGEIRFDVEWHVGLPGGIIVKAIDAFSDITGYYYEVTVAKNDSVVIIKLDEHSGVTDIIYKKGVITDDMVNVAAQTAAALLTGEIPVRDYYAEAWREAETALRSGYENAEMQIPGHYIYGKLEPAYCYRETRCERDTAEMHYCGWKFCYADEEEAKKMAEKLRAAYEIFKLMFPPP